MPEISWHSQATHRSSRAGNESNWGRIVFGTRRGRNAAQQLHDAEVTAEKTRSVAEMSDTLSSQLDELSQLVGTMTGTGATAVQKKVAGAGRSAESLKTTAQRIQTKAENSAVQAQERIEEELAKQEEAAPAIQPQESAPSSESEDEPANLASKDYLTESEGETP